MCIYDAASFAKTRFISGRQQVRRKYYQTTESLRQAEKDFLQQDAAHCAFALIADLGAYERSGADVCYYLLLYSRLAVLMLLCDTPFRFCRSYCYAVASPSLCVLQTLGLHDFIP